MSDRKLRTLGVGVTLGWAVLAFLLAQAAGLAVMAWLPPAAARYDGKLIALTTLATAPVQIAILAAVARRVSGDALSYLGWVGFSRRDLAIGVVLVAMLIAAVNLFAHAAGLETVSPFQIEAYGTARRDGWLWLLCLAVVVVGPLGEEVVFRGFLFRGCVGPGPRGLAAALLLTLAWAGLHFQYDWFGVSQVFLIGLILTYMRWRTGSMTLAFVLHGLVNAESTIETFLKLGWSM